MALRTGILGLGKMGLHHARCLPRAEGLELAGACDRDPGKAGLLDPGVPFTTELDAFLEECEAVVLAVPTDRHEELGRRILGRGRHLLVEKPLAATVESCERLSRVARTEGCVLGVGHVERMNGGLSGLSDRIRPPRFVEGHRLAVFGPRGTEVDVVLDLMIHDLDLVLGLFGSDPERVEAVGVAVMSDRVDIANARLEFPGGSLVNLTASRVSREPVRKLRLFQEEAYLSVDLRRQRAEIYTRDASSLGFSREVVEAPEGYNPLVRELEEFGAACRGEPSRLTTVEEGTRAVALASRILDAIEGRRVIWRQAAAGRDVSWVDRPS